MSTRESGFELLRIISMIFVLALHANFMSIGKLDAQQFNDSFINASGRAFFECISIVAVNVFVLISGWFGITVNKKKFCSFLFQCLFFSVGLYVVKIVFGHAHSIHQFLLLGTGMLSYWFVISYIGLYIFSPVLNSFACSSDKNSLRAFVVSFFLFEFVYGFIFEEEFAHGYCCLHLVGMYILGRYLRLYAERLKKMSFRKLLALYILFALTNTAFLIVKTVNKGVMNPQISWIFNCDPLDYTNPLVILSSVFLLLSFSKLEFKNSIINFIASSSLAAYLFHLHPVVFPFYKDYVLSIYNSYNGVMSVFLILCFMLLVFSISIVLDKIREFVWRLLFDRNTISFLKNQES